MPTGKVKFYDSTKGFGFIHTDEGHEVHLPASALPEGVTEVRAGTRLEFGVAEGRRGPQALSARILTDGPSVVRATRRKPQDMAVVVEDLIKWMDVASNSLRKGKYPQKAQAEKIAMALRKVADELEA